MSIKTIDRTDQNCDPYVKRCPGWREAGDHDSGINQVITLFFPYQIIRLFVSIPIDRKHIDVYSILQFHLFLL